MSLHRFAASCALALLLLVPASADAQIVPNYNPFIRYSPAEAVDISAGYTHTCALTDCGRVVCWGGDGYGQSSPPSRDDFVKVSSGLNYSCGLTEAGTVECWGATNNTVPPGGGPVPTGLFSDIDAGWYEVCGIRPDGYVCWNASTGQVTGYSVPGLAPVPDSISMGANSVASLRNGELHTFGPPAPPATTGSAAWGFTPYAEVSMGYLHTCVVSTQGRLSCWGNDSWGQTSGLNFSSQNPNSPYATTGIHGYGFNGWDWQQVDAGAFHSCAIKGSGFNNAYCWGADWYGMATPPTGEFIKVTTGFIHSCGIESDGSISCWGDTGQGQGNVPSSLGMCAESLIQQVYSK